MEKILTLIIPSYNMEKYLDRCLSSLVVGEEQMPLFEALIINDGSKDHTSGIGHRFESRYPDTFRVIDKENGHYGSCVNRGLAEARGIFVKILDADDSFDTDVFSSFLSFLHSESVRKYSDVVISDYSEVGNDLTRQKVIRYSRHSGAYSFADITNSDKHEWFIHGITYRTDLLKGNNYRQTEKIAYTDLEWAFVPLAYAHTFNSFEESLYLYTNGREEQSVEPAVHARNLWMETDVAKKLVVFYTQHKDSLENDARNFLFDRLTIITNHIYQLYLLTFKKYDIQTKPLFELDGLIKDSCPELYERTGHYSTRIAGITFHPIKNWRSRSPLCLVQTSLYQFVDRIAEINKNK